MECRQILESILTDLFQRSKQKNPPRVTEVNKTEKGWCFSSAAVMYNLIPHDWLITLSSVFLSQVLQ